MGSKSQTTTQSNTPPAEVMAQYKKVTDRANNVADTPYQAFGGQLVSPMNGQQNNGLAGLNNFSTAAQPWLNNAAGLASNVGASTTPGSFNLGSISPYLSPYQSQVTDATMKEIANQNAQQSQQLQGNTIQAGAFGGDRAGVAQAVLANQQGLASNQTLANLNNQNYSQALAQFNNQQRTGLGAAQLTGGLGAQIQQAGLQGASANLQGGTQAQQTQQAQDTANYNQFLQKLGYNFQTTDWLSKISQGIGANSGGTSTKTEPGPSPFSQILGAGLAIAGLPIGFNHGGAVRSGYDVGGGVPYQNDGLASWVPMNDNSGGIRGSGPPSADLTTTNNDVDFGAIAKGLGSKNAHDPSKPTLGDKIGSSISSFLHPSIYANGGGVRPHYDDGGFVMPSADDESAYIQSQSPKFGVDPAVASKVVQREGLGHYIGDGGSSFGPFQLHYGSINPAMHNPGLGDEFTKATGLDARDPSTWKPQVDFSLGYAAKHGWSPWMGAAKAGITGMTGINGASASAAPANNGLASTASSDPIITPAVDSPSPQVPLASSAHQSLLNRLGIKTTPDINQALLSAGLGMMASKSPFVGTAIGEGGQQGLDYWKQLQGLHREQALADASIAGTQSEIGSRTADIGFNQQRIDQAAKSLQLQLEQFGFDKNYKTSELANATRNTDSEISTRAATTAASLQTSTAGGLLIRDPKNPSAPPKLIPWDQVSTPDKTDAGTGTITDNNSPPTVPAPVPPSVSPPVVGSGNVTGKSDLNPVIPSAVPAAVPAAIPAPNANTIKPPIDPRLFSAEGQKIVGSETDEALKSARSGYEASQGTQVYLEQMRHAIDQLPATGWLSQGEGLGGRADVVQNLNSVLRVLGVDNSNMLQPNALASSEELKKLTTRMGFDLARSLGGREPGMVVQQAVNSVPGQDNSPMGAKRLMAGIGAMAQRQDDYYKFLQDWSARSGGSIYGADNAFSKIHPPKSYADNAIRSTLPPEYVAVLKNAAADPAQAANAKAQFDRRFGNGTSDLALSAQ